MLKSLLILLLILSHITAFSQENTYPKVEESVLENYQLCLKNFQEIPSKNIRIKKRKQLIPLTTIPSVWNLFRQRQNWTYKVNISTKTIDKLSPILYDNLSHNGKIGVLAHELSHVHDFHINKKSYLLKVFFSHASSKKMDAFEYNTDLICIQQGMGMYLLAWSNDVKEKLNIEQWEGKNTFSTEDSKERYMRPETICSYIVSMPTIYNKQNIETCIN